MQIKSNAIEIVDIHTVTPNPKNANKHSDEQIERLINLIKYQGFRNPLIVSNRTGFLVVGHGRLMAAQQMGLKKIPIIRQDFESEAQEYAYLISDNEIARWAELDLEMVKLDIEAIEDIEIEMLGLKEFEIEVELIPESEPDDIPETIESITKKGDIWLLGRHRLMCGDSTMIDDFEKLMLKDKADMVFTDPPYGDGHAAMEMNRDAMIAGKGNIVGKRLKIANDENLDIMPQVAANLELFSKDNSPKIVFFKWSKYEEIKEHWSVFGEPSSCCVWDRDQMAAATFIFNPCHEFAFFWGLLAKKQNKSALSNVWRCKKERENKTLHPTVKPIEICENAIDAACVPKGLVVDAFGGSGSTLIACEITKRRSNLMELEPKYCDVIVNRWQKFTGKKATLEQTNETFDALRGDK